MPWTTGTTPYFANQAGGSLGVVGKLLDYCASIGYEETVGTGDGVETTFSYTLLHIPVATGQCRIRYKIGGVDYEAWENEGYFYGSKIDTGTLNKATGEIDITFTDPVDNSYVIKTKYTDASVSGRDWLIMRQTTTKTNTGSDAFPGLLLQEVILRNSGISEKESVVIGLREWQHPSTQKWGINLNIYHTDMLLVNEGNWNFNSGFTGKTAISATSYNYTGHPSIYLKDAETIEYWFFCNKRRIIIICRTSGTLYMSAYIGFGKRYSTPTEYPKPALAAGNYAGDYSYNATGIYDVTNLYSNVPMAINYNTTPLAASAFYEGFTVTATGTPKKTTNSKVNIHPITVRTISPAYPNHLLLFELDGIFKVMSEGVVVQDTITIGSDIYTVFQNIYRTTYSDYFCVKQE